MSTVDRYKVGLRVSTTSGVRALPEPEAFTLSLDIDRRPYVQAEAKVPHLTDEQLAGLDPRTWPLVYVAAERFVTQDTTDPDQVANVTAAYTSLADITAQNTTVSELSDEFDGTTTTVQLPNPDDPHYSFNESATFTLYCTNVQQEGDGWVLTLQSGEIRLEAQRRISGTTVNMATLGDVRDIVATVLGYVDGFLQWGGGAPATVTGDAALWNPGESIGSLIDPILEMSGLRVYAEGAQAYSVAPTGEHTGFGLISTLVVSKDLSLRAIRRSLSVDEDLGWYDGVLVEYRYVNSAGNTIQSYDRYPFDGVHTRGLHLVRERANPGPGAARAIWRRSQSRGLSYEVEMALLPQVTPGWACELHDPYTDDVLNYAIKSIDFDYSNATMTLLIQPPPLED